MNKRIQRLSLGLAALICLQGFALGATEDDAQMEPKPTVVQEVVTPVPEPAQTEVPSEATSTPASPDTPAPPSEPENTASVEPTEVPEATQTPEITVAPTSETTQQPEPSQSPEAEPTPEAPGEQTEAPTPEVSPDPTDETTPEPSPEVTPTAEPEYICGLEEHTHDTACYDEEQNLICEKPEHTHDASCLPETTPAPEEEEDQSPEDVPTEGELIIAPRVDEALWRGVKPSDERGMAIPMLFQGDYAHVVCTIGGIPRSVATSGCGATSLSMVIAYLTGNTEQNPYTLFCDSVDAGRYHGSGWSHETLSRFAADYGVHSRWISNDADAILSALREGKPVIAHMGPGIFTSRGHYLVLRGLTEDGLVLMNDPNSRSNCAKAFPIDTLLKQAKNSESFMVCWSDDMPQPETIETTEEASRALRGDLNGSGSVDVNDVQMLYGLINSGETDDACDVNGDGVVDQADLDALLDAILNPEAAWPEENEGGDLA